MSGIEEVFVTEEPGLRTRIIRGIHHIAVEEDAVRIFTYDKVPHPNGMTERRVNGDFVFKRTELLDMIFQVSEILYQSAASAVVTKIRSVVSSRISH